MKINKVFLLIALTTLAVGCAHKKTSENVQVVHVPEKAAPTVSEKALDLSYGCLVNKDLRVISLDKSKARCEVMYKKSGETEQVAWAEATPSICTRVFDQIRSNIEEAGFKCSSDLSLLRSNSNRQTASQ